MAKPRVRSRHHRGFSQTGQPVAGESILDGTPYSEGFEENVAFWDLLYLDRDPVDLGHAFESIAPLLWLKSGARGPTVVGREGGWSAPKGGSYGILFDTGEWRGFIEDIVRRDEVRNAFVVTDSTAVFQQIAAELPDWIATTMLYDDYVSTFEINTQAREARAQGLPGGRGCGCTPIPATSHASVSRRRRVRGSEPVCPDRRREDRHRDGGH